MNKKRYIIPDIAAHGISNITNAFATSEPYTPVVRTDGKDTGIKKGGTDEDGEHSAMSRQNVIGGEWDWNNE